MKYYLYLLICLSLVTSKANAEIQLVTLLWRAEACQFRCSELLERKLKGLSQVAEVVMDQPAGKAELRWKPNIPFNFSAINFAMRSMGLTARYYDLTIRGTITHSGQRFTLKSLGDNSTFSLLGPRGTSDEIFVPKSMETMILPKAVQQQLLQAEENDHVVTIQGRLYRPQSNPTNLSVIKLTVENQKD